MVSVAVADGAISADGHVLVVSVLVFLFLHRICAVPLSRTREYQSQARMVGSGENKSRIYTYRVLSPGQIDDPMRGTGHHHHRRGRLREVPLHPSGPPQVSDIV